MGSPLGLLIANVFMTELEKDIIQNFIFTFGMLMTLYY